MNHISDDNLEELVRLSTQGDSNAFRKLFDMLEKPLFGYLSARTDGREDAKDLLQDVFVDFWRALPRFSYASDKAFYGFVYRITKRKLARYYRRRKKTVELTEAHLAEDPESGREDVILLPQAVRKLKPKYREVVELRYWSDLPFADIAKLLGAKVTTVKVRHHRAMEQLRRFLHDAYEK